MSLPQLLQRQYPMLGPQPLQGKYPMPGPQPIQGLQPPLGHHFYQEKQSFQGGQPFIGNYPANYQTYVPIPQPIYGQPYAPQPFMGASYPRVHAVLDYTQCGIRW